MAAGVDQKHALAFELCRRVSVELLGWCGLMLEGEGETLAAARLTTFARALEDSNEPALGFLEQAMEAAARQPDRGPPHGPA